MKDTPLNDHSKHNGRLNWWPFFNPFAVVAMLAFSFTASNWVYHQAVSDQIRHIQQEEIQKMISTEWYSAGKKRTVTSTQGKEETWTELMKRHKLEVAESMDAFPEDPAPK